MTFVNPAAERMMGYVIDDLLGQPSAAYSAGGRQSGRDPLLPGTLSSFPLSEQLCWRGDGTSFPIECESVVWSTMAGPRDR